MILLEPISPAEFGARMHKILTKHPDPSDAFRWALVLVIETLRSYHFEQGLEELEKAYRASIGEETQ